MPWFAAGTPRQYFLPLKISRPKKRPFCDFSDFVLFYGLFRNPVLAIPILYRILFNFLRSEKFPIVYKNLSLLGLIRFCTIICMFSELCAAGIACNSALIEERARICVYVPILSLFCSF